MRSLLSCKGQSIVEITLMTPVILIALYVPFDFGISIFMGHLTQIAVRDGARIASSTDSMTNAKAAALANDVYTNLPTALISGSTTKRVTVAYYADGAADCAQNVEVTGQGSYSFFFYRLMALLGMSPPSQLAITRTTKMWYNFQPDQNGGTAGTSTTFCTTLTYSGSYPP